MKLTLFLGLSKPQFYLRSSKTAIIPVPYTEATSQVWMEYKQCSNNSNNCTWKLS